MKGILLTSLLSILPRCEYLEGVKNTTWGVVGGSLRVGRIQGRSPLFVLHRINDGRWRVCSLPIVLQLGALTAKVEVCAIGVHGVDYFCSSLVAHTTPFSSARIFEGKTLPLRPKRVAPKDKPLPRYKSAKFAVAVPKVRTTFGAVAVRLPPIQIQEP